MDILEALHNANPARGVKRCKLQATIDDIPDERPNKDALIEAVADNDFAAQRLTISFTALGIPISASLISDHRAKRCRCYR